MFYERVFLISTINYIVEFLLKISVTDRRLISVEIIDLYSAKNLAEFLREIFFLLTLNFMKDVNELLKDKIHQRRICRMLIAHEKILF